jgi:hypothetical protein
MWTELICKLVKLYAKDETYLELAVDLADPMNNKSTQRLAAALCLVQIPKAPKEYLEEFYAIFMRLSKGAHYELRMQATMAFS